MGFTKITWTDRRSEYPNRRRFLDASTQQLIGVYDVERYEGTVTQPGTAYDASTMNSLQDNIEAAIGVEETGILTAGSTSITLSNAHISTGSDCSLSFQTTIFGVNPTAVSVSNGSVTLTFPAQAVDMGVKAVIKYDVV